MCLPIPPATTVKISDTNEAAGAVMALIAQKELGCRLTSKQMLARIRFRPTPPRPRAINSNIRNRMNRDVGIADHHNRHMNAAEHGSEKSDVY